MNIGQKLHVFYDSTRIEQYAEKDHETRRIITSVYYPAIDGDQDDRNKAYAELFAPCQDEAIDLLKSMGVDQDYFLSLHTHVQQNSKFGAQGEEFPGILLSPAFGVVKDMYIFLIEKLVACGFIVVAVGATYESIISVFPDGTSVIQAETVSKNERDDEAFWQGLLQSRIEDIGYVIGHLNEIEEQLFENQVSFTKVGVIGHSLGGAAVFEAAKIEERIEAGIMLDPSFDLINLQQESAFEKPFLVMRQQKCTAEELEGDINSKIRDPFLRGYEQLHSFLDGYGSFLRVAGAHHLTFCDVPVHFNEAGVTEIHEAISECTATFFSEFIMGTTRVYQDLIQTALPFQITPIDHQGRSALPNTGY